MINAINDNPTEKERIRKIKTVCSCGAEISNGSMEWHLKSKKHLSTEELKQPPEMFIFTTDESIK